MLYEEILSFWFDELSLEQWFSVDSAVDKQIRERFLSVYEEAGRGELYVWRNEPTGRLAEIIVLDQFSRNLYRNSSKAFQYDAMALVLAQEAVSAGDDKTLSSTQKHFLYMPYMHSESKKVHEEAIRLFSSDPELAQALEYELKHKEIVDRFGRYPHRNEVLGRKSTPEEIAFLKREGRGF